MDKKIWLVGHYIMPPEYEVRWKSLKYAEYLQRAGYQVLLVSASTIHDSDINLITGKEKFVRKMYGEFDFVHIKCSKYRGSGIRRIRNMRQFARRFKKIMPKFEKPDVIIAECNCVNYRGILSFARKHKIKFVSETRDLWPMSIVEYLGFSDRNPIIKFLYGQEKRMYRLSDAVIFSMPGGKDYIVDRGWQNKIDNNKLFYINNGIDCKEQDMLAETVTIADPQLDNKDTFKVVYAGSVRTANAVDVIARAARLVAESNENVEFLIYGNGDKKEEIEQYCTQYRIMNVHFKGTVSKDKIPYILRKCDLGILTYKQAKAWKYGGSQNKVFDYLYSGLPILTNIAMGHSILIENGCGVEIGDNDERKMAEAIIAMASMGKEQYAAMRGRAKNTAKNFDYKILTDKLIEVIDYVTSEKD